LTEGGRKGSAVSSLRVHPVIDDRRSFWASYSDEEIFKISSYSSLLIIHDVCESPRHYTEYCRRVRLIRTFIFGVTHSIFFGRALPDALAEMKALANIIQSSIEQIETAVTGNSFTLPSPDSTFSFETEEPRMHPAILSAGSLIASAAAQLVTLVRPAPLTLFDISMQVRLDNPSLPWIIPNNVRTLKFHLCTAMRTAISMHVPEILRDAPKVMLFPTIDSKAIHN
jgi:hypothetical protein